MGQLTLLRTATTYESEEDHRQRFQGATRAVRLTGVIRRGVQRKYSTQAVVSTPCMETQSSHYPGAGTLSVEDSRRDASHQVGTFGRPHGLSFPPDILIDEGLVSVSDTQPTTNMSRVGILEYRRLGLRVPSLTGRLSNTRVAGAFVRGMSV